MYNTLAERALPTGNTTLRNILLALGGSLVVAVAAQFTVPLPLVPLTLQSLAVLSIGAAYGARLGAATLALYVFEGSVGLPVFAKMGSGLAYVQGPTGGYLLGFILAAAAVGYLAERSQNHSLVKMFIAALLGAIVIHICGLIWLYHFTNGWAQTLAWGLMPFVAGDLLKVALVALGFKGAWNLLGRQA